MKEICLLDPFCEFPVIVSALSSLFFSAGGTEHQSFSMEQDSMMKELIFGKKKMFIP